jgi:hypothetical protein
VQVRTAIANDGCMIWRRFKRRLVQPPFETVAGGSTNGGWREPSAAVWSNSPGAAARRFKGRFIFFSKFSLKNTQMRHRSRKNRTHKFAMYDVTTDLTCLKEFRKRLHHFN